MRYLNRIVFVNSAHIRYKEIDLNGNVHFVGTQGVGKSTVLRAILFFYNGDKQKLGIPKEKKSFDEFYLEKANSYIVYEVAREETFFCVIVCKSQGRAAFRFVNGTYDRNWLVDSNGEVTTDFGIVRERISAGGRRISKIIDSYESYRDVIYGNRQSKIFREYPEYSLAESQNYQNIPRSIQNVFRNSKLDADFIKDTIINSIDDSTAAIDLRFFRAQVSEFEQEYNDIFSWSKKDSKGVLFVKKDADHVVEYYHSHLHLANEIVKFCQELNYAYRMARETLPSIQAEINETSDAISKLKALIESEKSALENERKKYDNAIAVCDNDLKKIRDKKKHYEEIHIDDLIAEQEKEPGHIAERNRLQEELRLLTAACEDINAKYRNLAESAAHKFEDFRQGKKKLEQDRINAAQEERNTAYKERESERESVERNFELKESSVYVKIELLKEKLFKLGADLRELKYIHPFENEIASANQAIGAFKAKEQELKVEIAEGKKVASGFTAERDLVLEQRKNIFTRNSENIKNQRKNLEEKSKSIEELISKQKGSLYEWLEINKADWTNNIGKIADEEILYNRNLSPRIESAQEASLFGIKLELSELPAKAKTPEEILHDLEFTKRQLKEKAKQLTDEMEEFEVFKQETERKYGPKISDVRNRIQLAAAELALLPGKVKKVTVDLDSWKSRDDEEIEKRREKIELDRNACSQEKLVADQEIDKVRAAKKAALDRAERNYKQKLITIDANLESYRQKTAEEIASKKEESDKEFGELKIRRENELESKGVDTGILRDYESKVAEKRAILDRIEKNRETVFDYNKDKRDLLDKEAAIRRERGENKECCDALVFKYQEKHKKNSEKMTQQQGLLSARQQESLQLKEDISKTGEYMANDNSCPADLQNAGESPTQKHCIEILSELKNAVYENRDTNENLRKAVNKFKSHFSARNTFKFKTELGSDEDYRSFASNLDEFLLENKIEDYKKRTSDRYTDILARISHEIGNMTQQQAEIKKIINEVNLDFRERNFAGVIKNIELRSTESSDRLMQLMLSIQAFTRENKYNLGGLNLFSDGNREEINRRAVEYLLKFVKLLNENPGRMSLELADSFQLQFNIKENDNDTGWVEKISNVGSDGTDILVKAMVNIMLINVFKERISRKFGDFRLHCMMDEIGKLHPSNVKGILKFANTRNIYLINGSPVPQSVSDYKYTYLLSKNAKSQTEIKLLLSRRA